MVSERMWKIEGLFAEAKQYHGLSAPNTEVGQKCKFRRTGVRLCKTSNVCSSHFIAGWQLVGRV